MKDARLSDIFHRYDIVPEGSVGGGGVVGGFLEFGIGDARVVHGAQALGEDLLDYADVAERQGRFAVEAVGNLPVDNLVDKRGDCLG